MESEFQANGETQRRSDARAASYRQVRQRTEALVAPLSAEDCCVQSMADASPAKWHLAHTSWFFETFVLERGERNFKAFEPSFRVLFNSYYNSVGKQHPRPQRGLLTRPSLDAVLAYRADVDRRMTPFLAAMDRELAQLVELGLNHEQQHQELLLTDIKHLFSCNPLLPAYAATSGAAVAPAPTSAWIEFNGGLVEVGHAGAGFRFDNETPRHHVYLPAYRLAARMATNGEYADFIAAGGYDDPALWLAEGWDWRVAQQQDHPIYWRRREGWAEFTLNGLVALDPQRPVSHVSYFEADAYARWAEARLPSEAEWEHAAATVPLCGHFAERGAFHPEPAGAIQGHGARIPLQMFGDAWEWTASSYASYPGFHPAPGAVGEYNGKFMVNQYVLRGGSCATPESHIRATYRNFFPAAACWQFSGIRLARDA